MLELDDQSITKIESTLAFLLWQNLSDNVPHPRESQYAVRFSISIQHSYFPLALASFLMRFTDHHAAYAENQLCLIRLCYQFVDGNITGIMYFNADLSCSFDVVRYKYNRHTWARTCFDHYGLWLSIWMDCPFYTPFPAWNEVEHCIAITK